MLDSKFFFTLVGLVVAVFAICNTNMSPAVSEGWWGTPAKKWKVVREVQPSGGGSAYTAKNNYTSMLGSNNANYPFIQRPNYQSILAPRFGNVDYGANIKYNMPSYENQAVPCDALSFGDMAKENYNGPSREQYECNKGRCGGGCGNGVAKCGNGGVSLNGMSQNSMNISADPTYTSAMNDVYNSSNTISSVGDLVSVGDMTSLNSQGDVSNPIVYDRFIYANQKSRLRAQGDPIRGDLPITPCGGEWFSVHPNPNLDLQAGAMNVMGGSGNETNLALSELIYASSGGAETMIGGINMSTQFATAAGAGGADINVRAFI
jgi:hypothetical protein